MHGTQQALQSGFYPQKCRLIAKVVLGSKFPGCAFHAAEFEPKEVFVGENGNETGNQSLRRNSKT